MDWLNFCPMKVNHTSYFIVKNVSFILISDKNIVRSWLQKLHSMPDDIIRKEYLWFLLRVLHCKKNVFPFNVYPPCEDLPPLKQVIVSIFLRIYVISLAGSRNNLARVNNFLPL